MSEIKDLTVEDIARVAVEKAREAGEDIDVTATVETLDGQEKWRLLVVRLHTEE